MENFESLLSLAEMGDIICQLKVGSTYWQELNDVCKALKWYEKAANNSNYIKKSNNSVVITDSYHLDKTKKSKFELSGLNRNRFLDVNVDELLEYSNVAFWHISNHINNKTQSSSDIHPEKIEADIANLIAHIYDLGYGDILNAIEYYREASLLGNANALHRLGNIYHFIKNNEEEAIKWFRNNISPNKYYTLGILYKNGEGFKQNYFEAFKYFMLAAETELDESKGRNEYAMFELGELYYYGLGVLRDFEKAAKWYQSAGERLLKYTPVIAYKMNVIEEDVIEDMDLGLPFEIESGSISPF